MSAKRILNSKKVLSDKDLEDMIAASDISDICDSEDNDPDEIDADYDSDDSIADKDYIPHPLDEDSYSEELQFKWRRGEKRKPNSALKILPPKISKLPYDGAIPSTSLSVCSGSAGTTLNEGNQRENTLSNNLFRKDGYKWSDTSPTYDTGKTPAKNVVYIRPGPVGPAKELTEPLYVFSLFFNDDILSNILTYTNERILVLQEKYKSQTASTSVISMSELKALFGLSILAAALKDNHLSTELLFDESSSGSRYLL
nr:unnamed protein product [Callosobruchus analis]